MPEIEIGSNLLSILSLIINAVLIPYIIKIHKNCKSDLVEIKTD